MIHNPTKKISALILPAILLYQTMSPTIAMDDFDPKADLDKLAPLLRPAPQNMAVVRAKTQIENQLTKKRTDLVTLYDSMKLIEDRTIRAKLLKDIGNKADKDKDIGCQYVYGFRCLVGEVDSKTVQDGISYLNKAAKSKNPQVLFCLGMIYLGNVFVGGRRIAVPPNTIDFPNTGDEQTLKAYEFIEQASNMEYSCASTYLGSPFFWNVDRAITRKPKDKGWIAQEKQALVRARSKAIEKAKEAEEKANEAAKYFDTDEQDKQGIAKTKQKQKGKPKPKEKTTSKKSELEAKQIEENKRTVEEAARKRQENLERAQAQREEAKRKREEAGAQKYKAKEEARKKREEEEAARKKIKDEELAQKRAAHAKRLEEAAARKAAKKLQQGQSEVTQPKAETKAETSTLALKVIEEDAPRKNDKKKAKKEKKNKSFNPFKSKTWDSFEHTINDGINYGKALCQPIFGPTIAQMMDILNAQYVPGDPIPSRTDHIWVPSTKEQDKNLLTMNRLVTYHFNGSVHHTVLPLNGPEITFDLDTLPKETSDEHKSAPPQSVQTKDNLPPTKEQKAKRKRTLSNLF